MQSNITNSRYCSVTLMTFMLIFRCNLPSTHERKHWWKKLLVKQPFYCILNQRPVYIHVLHTTDVLAYSKFAKMCLCYLHSTNRNRNFGQQNAIILQLSSEKNETLGKRNKATQNDWESVLRNLIRIAQFFWWINSLPLI